MNVEAATMTVAWTKQLQPNEAGNPRVRAGYWPCRHVKTFVISGLATPPLVGAREVCQSCL